MFAWPIAYICCLCCVFLENVTRQICVLLLWFGEIPKKTPSRPKNANHSSMTTNECAQFMRKHATISYSTKFYVVRNRQMKSIGLMLDISSVYIPFVTWWHKSSISSRRGCIRNAQILIDIFQSGLCMHDTYETFQMSLFHHHFLGEQ